MGDIFEEPRFRIRYTINDSYSPGNIYTETGRGFDYNQFKDSHKWVLNTDLEDMTFRFEVIDIIYQDGTRESF